jgi:hypothetical protein
MLVWNVGCHAHAGTRASGSAWAWGSAGARPLRAVAMAPVNSSLKLDYFCFLVSSAFFSSALASFSSSLPSNSPSFLPSSGPRALSETTLPF